MIAQPPQDNREELLSRSCSGVTVALLWSRRTGRAVVAVHGEAAGEGFELRVRETDSPLDLFDHPYAHAACRGIALVSAEAVIGV